MKVITKNDLISNIAERWRQQYYSPRTGWKFGIDKEEIHLDLLYTKTEEEITEIIGNKSWTRIKCDCCEKEFDKIIALKGCAYDEYGDTHLCLDCILQAKEHLETITA